MNLNGCVLCQIPILENVKNPDFRIELTGRKALPNYREGFLFIGFPDRSHSKLKVGFCSSCRDSVSSMPTRFYKTIIENVRQMWIEEMKKSETSIENVTRAARAMFSIEVFGYLNGEA